MIVLVYITIYKQTTKEWLKYFAVLTMSASKWTHRMKELYNIRIKHFNKVYLLLVERKGYPHTAYKKIWS